MSEKDSICESGTCEVYDFSTIFQLINILNKKYDKLQRKIIKKDNLTPPQHSILMQLWETDGKQFKELASACCCSPSTITGIVDTMEKHDLVYRENNPKDRRSLLVKLTDKGKSIENDPPPIKISLKNCCEGFTSEEIVDLTHLLKKLSDSFELGSLDKR